MNSSDLYFYTIISFILIYYLIEIILIKQFSIKLFGNFEVPSRLNFVKYIKYWITKFKVEGISNFAKILIIIWISFYFITFTISISFIGIVVLNFFKIKII